MSGAIDIARQGVALQGRGQRQRRVVAARRRYGGASDERGR